MDRQQTPIQLRPYQNRRDERAMRARQTRSKTIPDLFRSCPRAKHGAARAELIVDPAPVVETPQNGIQLEPAFDFKIRVNQYDTLTAASRISEKVSASTRTSKNQQSSPTVAVLNMASAIWPGGGFLDGWNRQEEYLCARTTLYPSLWNAWYPLPEISGIYTPDVLVFRDNLPDGQDLPKNERFFIDVISSSMPRFADSRSEGCTCGVSYCDRHRDIVLRKMKAVMRIAQSKGVEKLVLGAWGCGKLGNPVKEIAKCWRKVIAGGPRQRRPNAERWDGIKEIHFAIPDRDTRHEFELAFKDIIAPVTVPASDFNTPGAEATEAQSCTSDLLTKMAELELRLEQTHNVRLRNTLRQMITDVQRELSRGSIAAQAPDDEALDPEEAGEEDVEEDDYVMMSNLPLASDVEDDDPRFYALSSTSSPSSSPAPPLRGHAEPYEFRPAAPGLLASHPSHETEEEEESQDEHLHRNDLSRRGSRPTRFDPATGWFNGSVDGLTAYLQGKGQLRLGTGGSRGSMGSPRSPEVQVRYESGGGAGGLDPGAVREYLGRYEGSDVLDY